MLHEDFVERSRENTFAHVGRRSSGPQTLDSERPSAPAPVAAALTLKGLDGHAPQRAARASTPRPWKEVALARQRPRYFLAKRILDCILAVLGLVLALPLICVAWLLVRLTSRGPAIFCQERVGFRGRRFVLYKFRSMYQDNDERLHQTAYEQFLRGERHSGKAGDVAHDMEHTPKPQKRARAGRDPRITPVGYFLRRSSIDELPQLLNVLKGEMSIVGPRPPIPYEVGLYQEWHLGRLETLPGLTGLWQVHGRSRVSFDTMVKMDLEYIEKQSFWYDVKLILLTVPAVLSRKGAY